MLPRQSSGQLKPLCDVFSHHRHPSQELIDIMNRLQIPPEFHGYTSWAFS